MRPAALALVLALAHGSVAHADPPYSGAFRGLEAGGGVALADGAAGSLVDIGARTSTVIHLADLRVGYRLALPPTHAAHQLRASLQVHPLFLFLIASDTWGAVLSSIYLTAGAGPWWTDGLDLGWDWGAGLDVPLSDLAADQSWWIGAEWTRGCTTTGGPYEQHTLTTVGLRVGFRAHGL